MKVSFDTKHIKHVVVDRAVILEQELLKISSNIEYGCLVLENDDKNRILDKVKSNNIHSLEDIVKGNKLDINKELERILKEYKGINFSKAIASERSLCDYSFLINSVGYRKEDLEYMKKLVVNIVLLVEKHFRFFNPDVIVSGAPDSIFTYLVLQLAEAKKIKIILLRPGWLNDFDHFECGYLGNNLYGVSTEMESYYKDLKERELTQEELSRVSNFKEHIKNFQYKKMMKSRHSRDVTKGTVSPNIKKFFIYKEKIDKLNKDIVYTKPDLFEKFKANILRYIRKKQFDNYLNTFDNKIPSKSIFFPLHFQPEESTLVKGINYTNQIALIEHISKSIPLGYTLIVKEHPLGRGYRPLWQYKHIDSFYNVKLVELPSSEIVKNVDLVISISGTIGMESLVYEKPIIMLGTTYYMFEKKLFNHIENINLLDKLVYEILIEKKHHIGDLEINKFFLSYLNALKKYAPFNNNDGFRKYAKYIVENYELIK